MSVEVAATEFERRLARTREKMKEAGIDVLFVYSDEYHPGYSYYYTNFRTINCIEESAHALFIPLEGEIQAFLGNLNRFAAKRFSWIKNVNSIYEMETLLPKYVSQLSYDVKAVGVVGEELFPISLYRVMEKAFMKHGINIIDAGHIVVQERLYKSEAELDLIRAAGKLADDSILAALEQLQIGKTEIELSAIGEYVTRSRGGEIGSAYLVVSGPDHTNLPTWRPMERKIERGDYVWFDFNPMVEGYCSDTGIAVAMEGATEEQIRIMDFAYETNQRMVEFIKPGVTGKQLFQETLHICENAGLAHYFLPYTKGMRAIGHGVGLEVVEAPDLGPNSDFVFEPNMVFGIKFDLHGFPFGGVRVEPTVIISENGAEPVNDLRGLRNKFETNFK
ncbi:M24 family metallopeptidase [Paenibacillus xerothermodurans]|uniref:Aminopeptidase P family protein n=1 Tax=Paenibacillus xerothermodurans TaxID=1977292 RepID=A0A2W1P1D6_PAEXE|nr:Xaa-Pro peptidase family protein [Paenibacillus xerothermodurans]PZE20908.1 aminopeptidase P family protein [Paenibacillus xerothermodurans]